MGYDRVVAHAVRGSLLALLLAGSAAAYQQTLDLQSITDALSLGQSRVEAVRARFHQPYRLPVARPPVDYVEVVTPFRRVVLAAEEQARLGGRPFGQREALAMLKDGADGLLLLVELTLHPLNTYLGVPPYDLTLLVAATPRTISPRRIDRIPRYGARVDGMPLPYPFPAAPIPPAGSQPLLGGTLVAQFESSVLNGTGAYDVVISEAGKEIARTRVNLTNLR